jgi:hypothetical protein
LNTLLFFLCHGTKQAPYCSVATYVYAEKNLDDIYEALLENRAVVKCGRKAFSTNKSVAKRFEKDFGVGVRVVSFADAILNAPAIVGAIVTEYVVRHLH